MRLYPLGIWLYERLHSTYPFPAFESSIDEGVYGAIGYNVHVIINDTCIMWLSSLVFRQDRAHKASPSLHLSRTLRSEKDAHGDCFKNSRPSGSQTDECRQAMAA